MLMKVVILETWEDFKYYLVGGKIKVMSRKERNSFFGGNVRHSKFLFTGSTYIKL